MKAARRRTMNPVIDKYGTQKWFKNGVLHRTNGAAVIYANGDQLWYRNGVRHRIDGPAAIWPDGQQSWYLNGKLVNDPLLT